MRKGLLVLLFVVIGTGAVSANSLDLGLSYDYYMMSVDIRPDLSPISAVMEAGRTFGHTDPNQGKSFTVVGLGYEYASITPWIGWARMSGGGKNGVAFGVNSEIWMERIGFSATLALMSHNLHTVGRVKYKWDLATAHVGFVYNSHIGKSKIMAGLGIHY